MASDTTQRAEKMLETVPTIASDLTNLRIGDAQADAPMIAAVSLIYKLAALAEEALAARAYMDGLGPAMANAAANIPATDEWRHIKQTLANARAKTDKALEAL